MVGECPGRSRTQYPGAYLGDQAQSLDPLKLDGRSAPGANLVSGARRGGQCVDLRETGRQRSRDTYASEHNCYDALRRLTSPSRVRCRQRRGLDDADGTYTVASLQEECLGDAPDDRRLIECVRQARG